MTSARHAHLDRGRLTTYNSLGDAMGTRLAGKVAVITGGTSGIGEATLRLFLDEGASVVFSGRSAEAGERLAAELGDQARFIQADVTQEPAVKATIDLAV